MDRSAYTILVIIFAVFLGTVILSNLLASAIAALIRVMARRKVRKT